LYHSASTTDPFTKWTEVGPLGSLGAYVVLELYWRIMISSLLLRRKHREQSGCFLDSELFQSVDVLQIILLTDDKASTLNIEVVYT
jgi:hypothetical protein